VLLAGVEAEERDRSYANLDAGCYCRVALT
jgi:hypothetical protein